MARTITFIRHGQADPTVDDDMTRSLTETGINQARAFARAWMFHSGPLLPYRTVITSGVLRTVQTAETICEGMGLTPTFHVVREMFDTGDQDEDNLRYEASRRAAYKKLGPQSLAKFHDECAMAIIALGVASAEKLRRILRSTSSDVLIVGHGVYTNEIILDSFIDRLTSGMRWRLFNDRPLGECCGYHLHFDDANRLIEMEDILTDPEASHPDEK